MDTSIEDMTIRENKLHVMAIDCCEHVLTTIEELPHSQVTAQVSQNDEVVHAAYPKLYLIVIGVSRYPIRRLFISNLRRGYPDVPVLILRRVQSVDEKESIRGEFILSDQRGTDDCAIVQALRSALPLPYCAHNYRGHNYDTVREVVRLIAENFSDPDLNLNGVARQLPISAARLSRILNQNVGVSFRQLLRNTRIEEAKRMLAGGGYSIKEVAMRVGFSDSHYFSRSFKELTGFNASEFQNRDSLLFG